MIEALETSPSFVDHKWNNMDNQHRGIVTVMPIETVNEQKCRKFNVQFIISDNHYEFQGQSCRINNRWDIETP